MINLTEQQLLKHLVNHGNIVALLDNESSNMEFNNKFHIGDILSLGACNGTVIKTMFYELAEPQFGLVTIEINAKAVLERSRFVRKIVVICGFSASGKDTVSKLLSSIYNMKEIVTTTSRPIRDNEKDGVDYNFVTKQQFLESIARDEFVEWRSYNTLLNGEKDIWYYGAKKNSISEEGYYVIVLDILGLREFKKYYKEDVISFFLDVDDDTRKFRSMNRGSFSIEEWERRLEDDKKKFTKEVIESEIDFVIKNNSVSKVVSEIVEKVFV